jgi:hypothetical protein
MTDKLEQEKRESAFAALGQQVINNEAYKQAMTLRKAQIFETFCNTKQDQPDVREEAWRTMKNMNALEDYFRILLETGKMADQTLEANK